MGGAGRRVRRLTARPPTDPPLVPSAASMDADGGGENGWFWAGGGLFRGFEFLISNFEFCHYAPSFHVLH
jgi:hypothetical protein